MFSKSRIHPGKSVWKEFVLRGKTWKVIGWIFCIFSVDWSVFFCQFSLDAKAGPLSLGELWWATTKRWSEPVGSKLKTSFPPIKACRSICSSYFHAKMPPGSDKHEASGASTPVSSSSDRLSATPCISYSSSSVVFKVILQPSLVSSQLKGSWLVTEYYDWLSLAGDGGGRRQTWGCEVTLVWNHRKGGFLVRISSKALLKSPLAFSCRGHLQRVSSEHQFRKLFHQHNHISAHRVTQSGSKNKAEREQAWRRAKQSLGTEWRVNYDDSPAERLSAQRSSSCEVTCPLRPIIPPIQNQPAPRRHQKCQRIWVLFVASIQLKSGARSQPALLQKSPLPQSPRMHCEVVLVQRRAKTIL